MKPLPRSIARRLPASLSSDSADSHSAGWHDAADGRGAGNKENGGVGRINIGTGTGCAKTAAAGDHQREQALASEVAFLRQELSAIVEKHSLDQLAARKTEGAYQERIGQLAEELREVRGRLEAKDGTLRVLEKQVRGKNVFVDELRGRIEDLLRERRELLVLQQEANDAAAASASASASESSISGSNTSTFCPTPSFASSPVPAVPPAPGTVTPTRQTMRRSSGFGAGSIVRSARRTPDVVANTCNDASVSAPMTPPPFRSPSPTSRSVPRSLQHHYAPPTSSRTSTHAAATAQRDPSEGGIETPLTPSTRANFLLLEQKKTIESLTRALIAKTDECAAMEREFEQYKVVVAQETRGAYFLSRQDVTLVAKGPVNAESVLCDSDEFDMERSCSGPDGDDARDDDASTRSTTIFSEKKNGNGDNESAASDHFLNRLDSIGLDLSMDIADLSALIDDPDAPMGVGAANNGG